MLNKSGITRDTMVATKQILANVELQASVGCVVGHNSGVNVNGRNIIKAGTPVYGNLDKRTTPFVPETTIDTGTKGVYTVQITTGAVAGDKITISGTTYECAAAEDVGGKKFAGGTIAAQVTSLLKMVVVEDFVVAAVDGATDKIGFTQVVPGIGTKPTAVVTKAAENGAMVVGAVATATPPDAGTQISNANGIILHDVDVTTGNANATLLIFGFVNTNRLDTDVAIKITPAVKTALNAKVTFLKA